jgi:hypothetical protein
MHKIIIIIIVIIIFIFIFLSVIDIPVGERIHGEGDSSEVWL